MARPRQTRDSESEIEVLILDRRMLDQVVSTVSASNAEEPGSVAVCELCGGRVVQIHCKIKCHTCGYARDCSDP